MTYAPGEEADEKLHAAHHAKLVQGIRFHVSPFSSAEACYPMWNLVANRQAGERLHAAYHAKLVQGIWVDVSPLSLAEECLLSAHSACKLMHCFPL